MTIRRGSVVGAGLGAILLVAVAVNQLPAVAAGGLLHPARRPMNVAPPPGCEQVTFRGEVVNLQGWRCRASGPRRGSVVYLHGIADNRSSGTGIIERFVARGFDTVTYDSRAHGDSDGDTCTYGFFEKDDLRRVLDTLGPGPIVLIGASLGAAVALQHAGRDPRVAAVVAVESFSDLRAVATERAPFFFASWLLERAFTLAEQQGQFRIEAVSPETAARSIESPVLVIHGAADMETSPAHAQRVFAALAGPKRLILVPGAHHNGSLRGDIWQEIERWLDDVLASRVE